MRGVLGQFAEPHLYVAKLPFDHAKWVFDLRSHLSLGFLDPVDHFVQGIALAMLLVGVASSRNMPDDLATFMFRTLFRPAIPGVSAYHMLLVVQQFADLGDVRNVGGGHHHAVLQARVFVAANLRFRAEVTLIGFLRLMHHRATLAVLVRGHASCFPRPRNALEARGIKGKLRRCRLYRG